MLKPALARGLQLSGATTLDEYRKTIEKDAALTRRFQTILVDEPNVEQTVTMLRGLKPKLEVHHGVTISDSALVTAAVMSNRYIAERHLPDKAIDLVDEAAASLRIRKESPPEELDAVRRTITTLSIELSSLGNDKDATSNQRREAIETELQELQGQANEMDSVWKGEREKTEEIRRTREELEQRRFELEDAQRRGDFSRASELRYAVLPELEKKLPKEGEEKGSEGARVTADDVARVVSKVSLFRRQLRLSATEGESRHTGYRYPYIDTPSRRQISIARSRIDPLGTSERSISSDRLCRFRHSSLSSRTSSWKSTCRFLLIARSNGNWKNGTCEDFGGRIDG